MYSLPFKENQRIVELGGGNMPMFRPNVDVRAELNVDVVSDLSEALPFPDNSWEGIFCKYAIEHISWLKVRNFIKESYRILEPGGTAVFITANLLEQARILTEIPQFEDKWVCMVFGGNDYPENTHRAGFSPEFAGRIFKDIGFDRVTIIKHPEWRGDMIIEATKPTIQRAELFDKHYFNGGGKVGGYAFEGYRDFVQHWITFDKVMEYKPQSILEIGCCRGYLLKRFQDAGISIGGLEISHHCFLTRAVVNITEWDICQTPWPIPDKYFDFCLSVAVLEHIPEEYVSNVLQEIERVSCRGLHGVDFGEKDDGFDKTHCTLKSFEWWKNKTNQEIVNKEFLEQLPTNKLIYDVIPSGDEKIKVNVGSFTNMFHYGWINLDILSLEEFAANNYYKFIQKDVREGLPFHDDSVDLIYASHFIENLTYEEGLAFLKECKRVLKSGGIMRLITPDAKILINYYIDDNLEFLDEIGGDSPSTKTQIGKLWSFLFSGHLMAYDWDAIKNIGEKVGLKIEKKSFRQGHLQILNETIDILPELSIFVEMIK